MQNNHRDSEPSLELQGQVAIITLGRPGKLNRLSTGDLQTLQSHCLTVSQDKSIRVVLLTADTTGQKRPVFCAGYDVDGFEDSNHDPRMFEKTVNCVSDLPQIVVVVVNGSVYGGATDLVLACDLRIGLREAEFRMPACALGLHYYPSGLQRYVQVLGLDGAKQAFLTASALSFERLRELGAFVSLHSVEDVTKAGMELARKVADLAPLALQTTKTSLSEISRGAENTEVLVARETKCLASADFAEGRKAFTEKRQPRFTGN